MSRYSTQGEITLLKKIIKTGSSIIAGFVGSQTVSPLITGLAGSLLPKKAKMLAPVAGYATGIGLSATGGWIGGGIAYDFATQLPIISDIINMGEDLSSLKSLNIPILSDLFDKGLKALPAPKIDPMDLIDDSISSIVDIVDDVVKMPWEWLAPTSKTVKPKPIYFDEKAGSGTKYGSDVYL